MLFCLLLWTDVSIDFNTCILCFFPHRMETRGTPTPALSVTVGRDTSHATRSPALSVPRDRSLSSTPGSAAETVNHVRLGPCNQCKYRPQNKMTKLYFVLIFVFLFFFFLKSKSYFYFFFNFFFFNFWFPSLNVYSEVWYSLLSVPSRQSWLLPGL